MMILLTASDSILAIGSSSREFGSNSTMASVEIIGTSMASTAFTMSATSVLMT